MRAPAGGEPRDPLRARAQVIAVASAGPGDAAAVLGSLLPLVRDAEVGVAPPTLDPEEARAGLRQGRHLLDGHDLAIDIDEAHELLLRLARALEAAVASATARRLREALERHDPEAADLLPHVAAGRHEAVVAAARERDLDPAQLWTLAQAALRPALRACREALAPLVDGVAWERSRCPLCGEDATIGELREDGGRLLRCQRCGAGWRVRRILCPACGNEDHATLRTLYEEGRRATRRVEACDRCGRYLKLVAAASPMSAEELFLEDLATSHLDRAARARGYRAGG